MMSFTVRRVREEKSSSKKTRKWIVLLTSALESAVHLGLKIRKRNEEEAVEERRIRALKRVTTILISAFFVLLLLIGTLNVLVRLKAISFTGILSSAGGELPHDKHGFINVLLLGVGDIDHDGVDLTDTMMVASIDPGPTKSVAFLSLPRDIYVLDAGPMGKGRINSLYRDYKAYLISKGTKKSEASTLALKELGTQVGKLLDMEIQGVVKLNFTGFTQAIDAIGGVDVYVPSDLTDTEYPGPNYTYETFALSKGPHHLSGAIALQYARSRHSTSDFSRSARQQQIIAAAAAKVKAGGLLTNISRASDLLSIIAKNLETTFSTRELLTFANLGQQINQKNIVNMQLSDRTGYTGTLAEPGGFLYSPPRDQFEGASVLLPVSFPEFPVTWKQIQALTKLLFAERMLFIHPATIEVLNAGAKQGSARLIGNELIRYNFAVTDTRNYAKKKNPTFEKSSVAVNPALASSPENKERLAQAKETAKRIGELLTISSDPSPDPVAFETGSPDIIIVLGKDFSFSLLQDVLK